MIAVVFCNVRRFVFVSECLFSDFDPFGILIAVFDMLFVFA